MNKSHRTKRWSHGLIGVLNRITGKDYRRSLRREPLFLKMLTDALGATPVTMISVGSSDGTECVYANKLKKKDITIHLVEPDSENLRLCQKNLGGRRLRSGQMHLYNKGISNRAFPGKFYRNPDAPNLNSATSSEPGSIEMDVSYLTLTAFLKQNKIRPPIVVTMDIEGHEVEALEGLLEFAQKNCGIKILFEVHPTTYSEDHSLERILQKYFQSGYRTTLLESAGEPVPPLFRKYSMNPVETQKRRGLYKNPSQEFVLDAACREHVNKVPHKNRTFRSIVRAILIESPPPSGGNATSS